MSSTLLLIRIQGCLNKRKRESKVVESVIADQVIDILVSGMSMSEDSAAAAALAFRHICDEMAADGEVCGSGCQTCILRSRRCKFVTTALTILSLAEENSCLSQSVRIATRNISQIQHVNPQFDLIATELKQELEGSIKAMKNFFADY